MRVKCALYASLNYTSYNMQSVLHCLPISVEEKKKQCLLALTCCHDFSICM